LREPTLQDCADPVMYSSIHSGLQRAHGGVLAVVLLFLPILLPAEPQRIHTDRISPQILPLPKGDDVFHFVVFGDRTGGPAEGIKVLAQAVEDTNLLDPDLVMTVGDLVNGYNQTEQWMEQMREFRATMSRLGMPWFPVAGNHDIYWRPAEKNPESRPPRENEAHYEKHFGPLWYWFEHKKTGFLVLFSDEGHPDGRERSFRDPEQQRLSPTQMNWLKNALEEMKPLRHVFVFLHHPFWWGERYPGNKWDRVHDLLVRNGNVRAVIAGHIHQLRYDGVRDGIGYYALATTGGSLPAGMEHRYFGLIHHFNVVTVRSNDFSMASIPVGAVFDPRQFTTARLADVDAARYLIHRCVSPPISLNADGSVTAIQRFAVTNPCTLPIEVTLVGRANESWMIAPEHRHAKIGPGEHLAFEFACIRQATGSVEGYEAPEFEMRFDVLSPDVRLPMPPRSRRAQTVLTTPVGNAQVAATNSCLLLDGKSACLEISRDALSFPNAALTVEAWVRPVAKSDGGLVSSLSSGGFSLEIRGTPQFVVQTEAANFTAAAAEPLPAGHWSHLAGVYDSSEVTLYVNGKKVASSPAQGKARPADKSLYIGARPSTAWNLFNDSVPTGFWNGSIDEVRISRTARYREDFVPDRRVQRDDSSVVVISGDQRFGPFMPVLADQPLQAWIQGKAILEPRAD
jgi:hypothetical protein